MENKDVQIKELQQQKRLADKRLLNIEILLGSIMLISFLIILSLATYMVETGQGDFWPTLAIVCGFILLLGGALGCIYIEQKAGFYRCAKCSHDFVPTYNQTLWAMHFGRTRFMKCPNCNQHSWCKKIVK